jgi:hypothetical protein
MCVVRLASQLEVGELVGSAFCDRDAMVDLQAFGAAADNADSVAVVHEGSDASPFPAAPDLPPLVPRSLPVPFPPAVEATARPVLFAVAAGAEVGEGPHARSRLARIPA